LCGESLVAVSSRTVVYQLRGQLGNQLFEAATALGAGIRSGQAPCFNYNPAHGPNVRWFDLISVPGFPAASRQRVFWGGGWVPLTDSSLAARAFYRLVYRPLLRRRHLGLVGEGHSPFVPDPAFFTGRYRSIEGYFQHPDYFAEGVPTVTRAVHSALAASGRAIAADRSGVAVHVRGGDYLDLGWALKPSYYEETARAIPVEIAERGFVVYGDDPSRMELIAATLEGAGFSARLAAGQDGLSREERALDDLAQLASHAYLVISNSTYGWWAAALGDDDAEPGRIVVAPTPWAPEFGAPDLALPTWRTCPADFED
jgi:hypothetical protein